METELNSQTDTDNQARGGRITNTANLDPLILLAGAIANPGGHIEAMEAQGQRELVNSTKLPTRGREEVAALGIVCGEPDPNDPLFCEATLPEGWKKVGSDHDMWSYIVDETGTQRVAIFYKAAFYDRSAFMRLES